MFHKLSLAAAGSPTMLYKLVLGSVLIAGTVFIGSPALAGIIDLTPPNTPFFGPSYLQNFVFNNAQFLLQINGNNGFGFGNWIAAGLPQYNADGSTADIFLPTPQVTGLFVVPPNHAFLVPFTFASIGLASATNDRTGGDVVFTFTHTDGSIDSRVVTLKPGKIGLQTFTFDEQNVSSVDFFHLRPRGICSSLIIWVSRFPPPPAYPAPPSALDCRA
jgi:hypothetical protein